MATRSFDVVILGGGNAGMGVTAATREAGLTVAVIEPDLLGGTCPNRGCMPKKVLVAAAHALDEIERAKAHHIAVGKPSLDWASLIDREKAMIAGIPGSLAETMRRRGVEVIRSRGRFAGPNAVAVDGEILKAKHIVIATGSKPRRLPFSGAGTKVTILEILPRLLTNMDADAVAQLHSETERIGVTIHTGIESSASSATRTASASFIEKADPNTQSRRIVSSTAQGGPPISTASTWPRVRSPGSAGGSRSIRICARPPTRRSMLAAMQWPPARSCRRSPPMKGGSSAGISSMARSTRPIMRASRPAYSPFQHWRASA